MVQGAGAAGEQAQQIWDAANYYGADDEVEDSGVNGSSARLESVEYKDY